MEAFLPDAVKVVILLLLVAIFVLVRLSGRFPEVSWLKAFKPLHRSAEEQARRRRRSNFLAGAQFIGLGLLIPIVYVAMNATFFSSLEALQTALVAVASLGCIALGAWIMSRNR